MTHEPAIPPPRLAAVLFDLDGTLVDSLPDLARATDRTLAALQLPVAGQARVRRWVGHGVRHLVNTAVRWAADNAGRADEPTQLRLVADAWPVFLEEYAAANGERTRPLPGAERLLTGLRSRAVRIGLVTNKARAFTLPLLAQLGWADLFACVVCGDDAAQKKPSGAPLLQALDALEATPAEAVMIGDSDNDVLAAQAAQVPVVRVRGGYGAPPSATADLEDTDLDHLCALFGV